MASAHLTAALVACQVHVDPSKLSSDRGDMVKMCVSAVVCRSTVTADRGLRCPDFKRPSKGHSVVATL